MHVFISWSGDRSRAIADAISKWLPGVLQAVKPYFSPDNIAKGSRWATEIATKLEQSSVGLLCLTRENADAPWLMFEAGALAKNLDKSKVCPLLFGIDPTDVKGPLVQFQASRFSKDEMLRVVKMINGELGDDALASDVLISVFDKWWPDLEKVINSELQKAVAADSQDAGRTDRDLMEEVLALSRAIAAGRQSIRPDHTGRALRDLVQQYEMLVNWTTEVPPALRKIIVGLGRPIRALASSDHPGWDQYAVDFFLPWRSGTTWKAAAQAERRAAQAERREAEEDDHDAK